MFINYTGRRPFSQTSETSVLSRPEFWSDGYSFLDPAFAKTCKGAENAAVLVLPSVVCLSTNNSLFILYSFEQSGIIKAKKDFEILRRCSNMFKHVSKLCDAAIPILLNFEKLTNQQKPTAVSSVGPWWSTLSRPCPCEVVVEHLCEQLQLGLKSAPRYFAPAQPRRRWRAPPASRNRNRSPSISLVWSLQYLSWVRKHI